MEVEAKLATPRAAVLDGVAALKRLAGYHLHPGPALDLETLYLDTAERDLMRAQVAFRSRLTGDGVELTLKEKGSRRGTVHRRPERTWHVEKMPSIPFSPRPRALWIALEQWTRGAPLEALVATRVRRRPIEVRREGVRSAVAEIDLDQVRFVALPLGTVSRARYEIEVELRAAGSALDLQRIVHALRRRFVLTPSPRSKLEQALRWAKIGSE